MKFDRDNYDESFPFERMPEWTCPRCYKGSLSLIGKKFTTSESVESKHNRDDEDWEPEWVNGKFHGELICENKKCGEKINVSGKYEVEYDYGDYENSAVAPKNTFYPEYFYPYLKLFEVPEDFPVDLEEPLERVFKLFWIDNPACANAIRSMIEEILTDQRIVKTDKAENKRRKPLMLHRRIELFRKKNAEVAELLLALKWVGNYGSHAHDIQHEDILDGIDLLQRVFTLLYSSEDARVASIAKKINKKRKPIN